MRVVNPYYSSRKDRPEIWKQGHILGVGYRVDMSIEASTYSHLAFEVRDKVPQGWVGGCRRAPDNRAG